MLLGLAGGTFLLTLAAMVILACRFQSVGLFTVLVIFFGDVFFIRVPPFELGDFNLYPADLITLVLLLSALVRLLFRRPNNLYIGWGLFMLAALLSFVTGFQAYGLKTSANEFRSMSSFITFASYFSSFEFGPASFRLIKRSCYIISGFLMVLAIYRWAAEWFNLPILDTWTALKDGSTLGITRTLFAEPTLVLLQTWLLAGPSLWRKRSKTLARMAMFLPMLFVFALRHRTVWIAALACLILLFGRIRTLTHRPVWLAGTAVVICVGVFLIVLSDPSNPMVASIRYSVQEPIEARHSTLEWRVSSWQQLLGQDNRPTTIHDTILGSRPFGAGTRRYVDGSVVTFSAHNFYVETFLRTGAVGCFGLLFTYGMVAWIYWRNRFRESESVHEWRTIMASILISQLVYYMGYNAGYEQGILFGAAISLAISRQRAAAFAPLVACWPARRPLPVYLQPQPERVG